MKKVNGNSTKTDLGMSSAKSSKQREDDSATTLIKRLATDLSRLLSTEVALAKAEIGEAVTEAKAGAVAMLGGAILALAGVIVLLLACVYGIATELPLWLSALIVGASAVLIGMLMLRAGKKNVDPENLVPERTVEAVKQDKKTIERSVT